MSLSFSCCFSTCRVFLLLLAKFYGGGTLSAAQCLGWTKISITLWTACALKTGFKSLSRRGGQNCISFGGIFKHPSSSCCYLVRIALRHFTWRTQRLICRHLPQWLPCLLKLVFWVEQPEPKLGVLQTATQTLFPFHLTFKYCFIRSHSLSWYCCCKRLSSPQDFVFLALK